jgi:CHRD domain/PEP-CTERM motif
MKNGFLRIISGAALCVLATQASAAILIYDATLGNFESPPTGSPGTGFAQVTIDNAANTMDVMVTFSGLTSGTTASHIHCCIAPGGNAGVATTTPTFPGFPLGVTSGTYDQTFDLTSSSSYNPAFVVANGGSVPSAEAVLLAGLSLGDAYLNIHTGNNPGGEIRGFLTAVPEPSTWAMMILGFVGIGAMTYRRHKSAMFAA